MRSKLFLLLFCLLATTMAFSQTTATIVGTVTDTSGAVVPNTKVTAAQKAIGLSRSTTTNQSGNYVFSLLPVGSYDITAENTGFKKNTVTGILLQVNQDVRVDVVLEVGAVTETV